MYFRSHVLHFEKLCTCAVIPISTIYGENKWIMPEPFVPRPRGSRTLGTRLKFLLITLIITPFDQFVSHLNMLINCSNVLLQVGWVQSFVCCDLTLGYVSRFQPMIKELNLLTGQSVHWNCRGAMRERNLY